MVQARYVDCRRCGRERKLAGSVPGLCIDCSNAQKDAEKETHLAALRELSLEERVRRLEEEAYDRERRPVYASSPVIGIGR